MRPRPKPAAPAERTVSPSGEAGALARAGLLDVEGVLAELGTAGEGLSTAEAEVSPLLLLLAEETRKLVARRHATP